MALARANIELKDTRYKLEIKRLSSKCRPDAVLRKFIELYNMRNNLIGVLGPGDLDQHLN